MTRERHRPLQRGTAKGRGPWRVIAAIVVLALVLLLVVKLGLPADLSSALSRARIEALVEAAGLLGPVVIVALMTAAIVATPIPSAPIALAAGAAYGDVVGTAYIVIGAELGAMIAFGLARFLGRDVLLRWLGEKADMGLFGSQNALSLTVFASRLLPFVSFDLVSYAAGLSCLHFWRFSLATLAGIIPASYLLAHVGSAVTGAEAGRMTWAVLALGLLTGAPLIWAAIRGHLRGKSGGS